jgi:carbon storage regulator CsrA
MLSMTRHVGEIIAIGPDIRIEIQRIGDRQVRLAITAPRALQIERLSKAPRSKPG